MINLSSLKQIILRILLINPKLSLLLLRIVNPKHKRIILMKNYSVNLTKF